MNSRIVPVEILQNIFKYHNNDIKTLHSILLVNRYWARIVVEILWKCSLECARVPASNCVSKKLLDVYRRYVNSEELLFDYPSFLKRLDWEYLKYEYDGKRIFQMLLQKSKNLSYLAIDSYNRNIGFYNQFDITLNEEILQNSTLKQIKFLKISDTIPNNLALLSKICNYIETLIIECVSQNQKEILTLIEVQCNLKNLVIVNSIPSFDKSFHPHSFIKRIKFDNRNNRNNYISHSLTTILQSCTKLESLEFYRWDIHDDECQELSKIHFPNLKSLKVEYSKLPFILLNGIIEVNGSNLEELCFIYDDYNVLELDLLSKTICQSCKQLSSLTLHSLQIYYQVDARKYRNFIKRLEVILKKLVYFKFKENVLKSPINIIDILNVLNRNSF